MFENVTVGVENSQINKRHVNIIRAQQWARYVSVSYVYEKTSIVHCYMPKTSLPVIMNCALSVRWSKNLRHKFSFALFCIIARIEYQQTPHHFDQQKLHILFAASVLC